MSGARPLFVGVALGTVYVVWDTTYLAIRIMVEQMLPLVGAGVRFLAAGVLVAGVLVARRGESQDRERKETHP